MMHKDDALKRQKVPETTGGNAARKVKDGERTPSLGKRDMGLLIKAIDAGPVLSIADRRRLSELLRRLQSGEEPCVSRRRSRGRPASKFNPRQILAVGVTAEYMLALFKEGSWGAKPKALDKAYKWAQHCFPGLIESKRDIDDEFRRYKAAGITPRHASEFENCDPAQIGRLRRGNASLEDYKKNLWDEVENCEDEHALRLRTQLQDLARVAGKEVAISVAPALAARATTHFERGIFNRFQADFASEIHDEILDCMIESFALEISSALKSLWQFES